MDSNLQGNNILFISNFNKTDFFIKIAEKLKVKGIEIFWIAVNKRIANKLSSLFGDKTVLYISKADKVEKISTDIDLKYNEIIYSDRILRHEKEPLKYLIGIQNKIIAFFADNKIKYVIGELTWAHELLVYRLIHKKIIPDCLFLNPHTIRIPANRFAFFIDEWQSEFYNIKNSTVNYSRKEIDDLFVPQKPEYLRLNDNLLRNRYSIKSQLFELKRFFTFESVEKDDPTVFYNRIMVLKFRIKEKINYYTYLLIAKENFIKYKNMKYLFYALHKQPEASVDVLGRYYDDQYMNIFNIWRNLPADWYLLVKEHSNAIGDRSAKFYKSLKKLKNVILIDEKTDSHQIIMHSQAVITVSGTIAYEAALFGVKALVFTDVFFNLSLIRKITLEDLRSEKNIKMILDEINENQFLDNNLKTKILNNSLYGIISDPVSNPGCMTEENLTNIAKYIYNIITRKMSYNA